MVFGALFMLLPTAPPAAENTTTTTTTTSISTTTPKIEILDLPDSPDSGEDGKSCLSDPVGPCLSGSRGLVRSPDDQDEAYEAFHRLQRMRQLHALCHDVPIQGVPWNQRVSCTQKS